MVKKVPLSEIERNMDKNRHILMGRDVFSKPCPASYMQKKVWGRPKDVRVFDGYRYVQMEDVIGKYKTVVYSNKWKKAGFMARYEKICTIKTGKFKDKDAYRVWVCDPKDKRAKV